MKLPIVLGWRAEAACRLLNQTLGLHRLQAVSTQYADEPTRLAPPAFDGVQVQRQATFLRLISITEAFCVDRLLEVTEAESPPSGTDTTSPTTVSAPSNWSGIQDAYKNQLHIRPSWTRLNQLIEVRNAIAHGLGQLTRIQLNRRQSTVNKISRTGIHLFGNRVILEERDLQGVKIACLELISEIDGLVQAKTGDVS